METGPLPLAAQPHRRPRAHLPAAPVASCLWNLWPPSHYMDRRVRFCPVFDTSVPLLGTGATLLKPCQARRQLPRMTPRQTGTSCTSLRCMYTKSASGGILGVHTLAELPSDAILLRCMYTKSASGSTLGVHTLAKSAPDAILLRCMYTKSASGGVPGVHTPRGNRTISYTRTPEWQIGVRTA